MMLAEILSGLLLVILSGALGVVVARRVLGDRETGWMWAVAFPTGAGVWTWGLFVISWAGVPLTLASVLAVYLFTLTLVALSEGNLRAALAAWIKRSSPVGAQSKAERAVVVGSAVLLALLLGSALMLSVGRSHGSWDAAAGWVPKGYGIILEQTVMAGARWGAWGLAYPLNLPLQNGLFFLFGSEPLPASKFMFPIYLGSLVASLHIFWRRNGLARELAWVASVLLASNPLFYFHATIGYANLPLASYLVAGSLLGVEGLRLRNRRLLAAGGLLLALGAWTRPEGIAFVFAIWAASMAARRVVDHPLSRRKDLVVWFGPTLIVAGSWFLFGWRAVETSHLGSAMGGVLPLLREGQYRLRELYLIPRLLYDRALEPQTWGFLFPLSAGLLLLGRRKFLAFRRYPGGFSALFCAVAVSLVPVGVFYVRSFTRPGDFIQLLNRSFDRAFLPAAALILATAVLLGLGDRVDQPVDSA